MALKVIGSGLGRTGTLSLKLALEQQGFGPCHHMSEVHKRPDSIALWVEAGAGRPDWEAIFDGFQAMVDYPGCIFWRELMAHYPDAKVIHTVRDPNAWFASTQSTIFARGSSMDLPSEHLSEFMGMIHKDIGVDIHDREAMVARFQRHTAEVVATVPADRLLVYDPSMAWEPLCDFLGIPIPQTPYPNVNSTAEFQNRRKAANAT